MSDSWDLIDSSLPGSCVHGISQGRILKSRLPFPSLGDLPDTGIEFMSHTLAGRFYTADPPGISVSYLFAFSYCSWGFQSKNTEVVCHSLLQEHTGHLLTWGVHLSVSYLFSFSYCSWGSQGKNTWVVRHSLLQWTMFCQNSSPWPVHLGWPYTAWLIVSVVSLASFLPH